MNLTHYCEGANEAKKAQEGAGATGLSPLTSLSSRMARCWWWLLLAMLVAIAQGLP